MTLIDTPTIETVARLARIRLTEEEAVRFQDELSGMIKFIETLNELNTDLVEPIRGGTLSHNIVRPDENPASNYVVDNASLIHASPESEKGWIKVKAIFK